MLYSLTIITILSPVAYNICEEYCRGNYSTATRVQMIACWSDTATLEIQLLVLTLVWLPKLLASSSILLYPLPDSIRALATTLYT